MMLRRRSLILEPNDSSRQTPSLSVLAGDYAQSISPNSVDTPAPIRVYDPHLTGLRVAGTIMLISTIVVFFALNHLSRVRSKERPKKSRVSLINMDSVEYVLQLSSYAKEYLFACGADNCSSNEQNSSASRRPSQVKEEVNSAEAGERTENLLPSATTKGETACMSTTCQICRDANFRATGQDKQTLQDLIQAHVSVDYIPGYRERKRKELDKEKSTSKRIVGTLKNSDDTIASTPITKTNDRALLHKKKKLKRIKIRKNLEATPKKKAKKTIKKKQGHDKTGDEKVMVMVDPEFLTCSTCASIDHQDKCNERKLHPLGQMMKSQKPEAVHESIANANAAASTEPRGQRSLKAKETSVRIHKHDSADPKQLKYRVKIYSKGQPSSRADKSRDPMLMSSAQNSSTKGCSAAAAHGHARCKVNPDAVNYPEHSFGAPLDVPHRTHTRHATSSEHIKQSPVSSKPPRQTKRVRFADMQSSYMTCSDEINRTDGDRTAYGLIQGKASRIGATRLSNSTGDVPCEFDGEKLLSTTQVGISSETITESEHTAAHNMNENNIAEEEESRPMIHCRSLGTFYFV